MKDDLIWQFHLDWIKNSTYEELSDEHVLYKSFRAGWYAQEENEKQELAKSLAEFAGLDDCESGACKI